VGYDLRTGHAVDPITTPTVDFSEVLKGVRQRILGV